MKQSENAEEQKEKPTEETMRTEYLACQQSIGSSSLSYWTLSGVFTAFSTVLLGALIYAIFANHDLLKDFVDTATLPAPRHIWMLRIITSILAIATIAILCLLRYWLKRVNYLADLQYGRMRTIEKELKMCNSLVIDAIDHWESLTEDEKDALTRCYPREWFERKRGRSYEPSTRGRYYKWIVRILILLWLILAISVWFLPAFINWLDIFVIK